MSEKIKEMFCKPVYERALLAYCFKALDNFYVIGSAISDKDFLRPEHRLIWTILNVLTKKGVKKFDASMVIHEAKQNDVLNKIGGYDYIAAIMNMDLSDSNIQYYIDKVVDASVKFQLYIKLDNDLRKIGNESDKDDLTAANMISMVSKDVMDLSMKSKAVKEASDLAEGIDEYIEERRSNPVKFCGLSTGYSILDNRIDGLVPTTLHVLCARPKNGKTTFLSNIGAYVAYELRKPVLFVGTEDSFDEWRSRIISMLARVPERRIKRGGYSEEEYYNIQQATKLIKQGKYFHEYMPGFSVDKLISVYKKYKYVEDIGLAIFDYIKAPSGVDFKNKKEYQLLGDVTTVLKDLAGELNIPFLCATQINRQQDIADSDRILRYADVLMFFKQKTKEEMDQIHPFEKDYGTHKLVIKDSRRGGQTPEEGIGYAFLKRFLRIDEAPKQLIDYDSKEYQEKEEIEYDFTDSEEGWSNESELD